jgi:plastocyanin
LISSFVVFSYAENTNTTNSPQPDINANALYNNQTIVLGKNVKNFVIVIPDEAHESLNQQKSQLPLTDQPYLPQNLVTNTGTTIVWFNADVGHNHKITLTDQGNKSVYGNAFFPFNEASKPLTLNNTGKYIYVEAGANKAVPSFVMNGTITIKNLTSELKSQNASTNQINTVGALMIPATMLDKYGSELAKNGFIIDSHFTYKDLRGGQKGTGPEQVLITWTSPEANLAKVISVLKEMVPKLPYS